MFEVLQILGEVLKENQPRMWDDRKYELVVRGRPTRARSIPNII